MRVLVLGASGMLGNAILRLLSERHDWVVYGTLRVHNSALQELAPRAQILDGINADPDGLISAFRQSRPQVVINCIGIVKQLASAQDPLEAIPINSILPHRLAQLCELMQARLIHFSTDCVFSGIKGNYRESDFPDAQDLYGRSKLIGEVICAHAITLRTSIIGPELHRNHGLISRDHVEILGYNSRLDTFQAVVANWLLPQAIDISQKRISNAKKLDNELSKIPQIKVPMRTKEMRIVYHLYIVFAEKRDELLEFCLSRDIEAKIHYPIPMYKQKALGSRYNLLKFPITDHHAQNIISFPCDQHLIDSQLKEITDTVKEFYGK
jgi:dTDP-4-dehydrorhamnose reductase